MNEHEPSQEFRDLIDALTYPRPSPSATIRVAEFHFGEGRLTPAIEAAGMTVVADLDARSELPDFTTMSEFDLVVTDAPEESDFSSTIQYLLRFLRVRRPPAFAILGITDEKLKAGIESASRPHRYEVAISRQDGLDFIAGVSELDYEQIAFEALQEVIRRIEEKVAEGC